MVRIDDSGGEVRCWLHQREISELEKVALSTDWTREIAIQLMGECGLRASEVPYPSEDKLRWSDAGDCWLLEVRGKNTKGGEKSVRDAWVPNSVVESMHRYVRERGYDTDDNWVDVSTGTVRRWVREAAVKISAQKRDERWSYVSSHDLRRSWATYHLVERGIDVRTMMAIGGWSSYSAIEPYLAEPTEARIGSVMAGT